MEWAETQAAGLSSEGVSQAEYLKQQDLSWIWAVLSGGSPEKGAQKKNTAFSLLAFTLAGKFICPVAVPFLSWC